MKYYKYFYWVYLLLAVLFIYDGYDKYTVGDSPWVSFLLAGLAAFMFFSVEDTPKKWKIDLIIDNNNSIYSSFLFIICS